MSNNFRAALFDVDGLLVDSETVDFKILLQQLGSLGINISLDEATERFTGVQNPEVYETLKAERGVNFDVGKALAEHYAAYERALPHVAVLPGAREIVRRCKGAGYKTAIVSGSKRNYIDSHVRRLGINVDFIVSSEDVPSKPDPAGYLTAAEMLGIAPVNCIVFEDSTHGIQAGKAAGCYVVGVGVGSNGKQDISQADARVYTLRQVPPSLLRNFAAY